MRKEGIYRKNQKGFGFVKVEGEEGEIYIAKENSKNALNGDKVLVKILQEEGTGSNKDKSAEGKVVEILKHEKDVVVGIFQNSKNFGFVVPDDRNFGTDIFISKKDFGKARNNHKVLVKITKFPEKGKNAEGKVIEVIGNVNEAGVDMLSLIKEHNLPSTFPKPVVKEAEKFGQAIDKNDIKNRVDLRDKIIVTIDGEDAKDLDDAVRVEKLENGNYRLEVHIADVSHYVKENSLLDQEALLRGTSIYMLGRVIPMLPRELSNGLCSLNAGEDRFTLSCIMEIDPKGKVVSSQVYKAVINVTERMSYKDVQKIIDGSDEEVLERYKPYIQEFKNMEELKGEIYKKIVNTYHEYMLSGEEKEKSYKQMGLSYIQFAKDYPVFFKIMLMGKTVLNAENFVMADKISEEIIKQGQVLTGLTGEEQKKFHVRVWIFTHGIACLVATNTVKLSNKEIEEMLENTVRQMAIGYQFQSKGEKGKWTM